MYPGLLLPGVQMLINGAKTHVAHVRVLLPLLTVLETVCARKKHCKVVAASGFVQWAVPLLRGSKIDALCVECILKCLKNVSASPAGAKLVSTGHSQSSCTYLMYAIDGLCKSDR